MPRVVNIHCLLLVTAKVPFKEVKEKGRNLRRRLIKVVNEFVILLMTTNILSVKW
jgi:hypothetical protein